VLPELNSAVNIVRENRQRVSRPKEAGLAVIAREEYDRSARNIGKKHME
jgi:hypothetical protein